MCGIAGILDSRGEVTSAEVRRMTDTLAHRGPDEALVHVEEGLGLGVRRLAVIDLVTGSQPMANEDSSALVAFNGEIYNHARLRTELKQRGHRFRSRSDTEILVHLYEERGADLVDELRGMFAFAIWDVRNRRLLLARDHLGQKPLFWARRGSRFYFASEIKAILAAAPEFRSLDARALDEYLTLRIISDPRSMFEGIHKLPPAHVLLTDSDEPVVRRFWHLRFEPKSSLSEEEAVERLDHEIRETVRHHLVSDVPIGAFLSGGIDSALIASYAQSLCDTPLPTFTLSVPYREFDESPTARLTAEALGTRHAETRIDEDLVTSLPRLVHHLDEPSDPLSACVYHLAGRIRQDVKVVLGGDGGDELFGGYDRYYGVPLARHYVRLPRAIRRWLVDRMMAWTPDGRWYKSLNHKLRWLEDIAEVEGGRRYARSLGYFHFSPENRERLYTERFRARIGEFDSEGAIIAWYERDDSVKETLDRMLLADAMVRMPNHPVMILDRMTMAHGLEARSPFLDHRLAEFTATLPVRLKVRGHRRRYLQTRLAERYLPPEVLTRPKQGFSSGLLYAMAYEFEPLFDHFLTESHLVEAGLFRPDAIQELLDEHLSRRVDHGHRLWLLLNAELWHRIRIEEREPEDLQEEIASLPAPRTAEVSP